jgi:gamma-glutamyltranspeptidase / glutathione hydrolase
VTALNASGRAPAALTIDLVESQGLNRRGRLPQRHAHTVTVPGACSGWAGLLERHGTMQLRDVLAPAIRIAEEGYPVSPIAAHLWQHGAAGELQSNPGGQELMIDGRAPRMGDRFRNPTLANTFRIVAEGGPEAYYRGPIAQKIVDTIQAAGGVMTLDDLAQHRAEWVEPISTTYRGVRIWECPPNGQGLAALLALNVLDLEPLPPAMSVERLHLQIETMRLAFVDTNWYVADPAFSPAPLEGLLSREYAAQRRALIQPDRASLDFKKGSPVTGSETVYLCAVDEQGNACSFIVSNYNGFGTGLVPVGCGFSLQNRGFNFLLDPAHPNALAPGKRPYHTIIPGLATRADGSLLCPFGVMGGFMQPQGHMQVMVNMLDDGLDPQSALDLPRFCISGDKVYVEEGLPLDGLRGKGHQLEVLHGYERAAIFGRGQIILRQPDGSLCAGSDPRGDGCAMGW